MNSCPRCGKENVDIHTCTHHHSITAHIFRLYEQRKSLIYDWDKILPENRERFEAIQKELCDIDEKWMSK